MDKIKISIIIPTYRPQEYLWHCLESIDSQTLDHAMFEVIVVLNGDKAPYFEEIIRNLKLHSFQHTLLWSPSKGVSNARNLALEKAKGLFICFIDDDDWISKKYLEGLLDKATPDGIVVSNVVAIDQETQQESFHYLGRAYMKYEKQHASSVTRNYALFSSACCKMIPRAIIGSTLFDPTVKRGEDALFMFIIARKVSEVRASGQQSIYFVQKRPESSSRKRLSIKEKCTSFITLSAKFTHEYVNHITQYNFLFYISRILGLFKNRFLPNKTRNNI